MLKALIIGGIIMLPILLIILIVAYYNNVTKRTYKNLSDAELIRLIQQLGVVKGKGIAAHTALTKSEASTRISILGMYGIIQTLYDSSGVQMYQVKDTLPQTNQIYNLEGLSPQDVVKTIVTNTGVPEVTVAQLIILFDLNHKNARKTLKELVKQGVLTVSYSSSWRKIYTATHIPENLNPLQNPITHKRSTPPIIHQLDAPKQEERIRIPDADVLQLAIDNDGRITPILLCAEKRISLQEAKEALDSLYDHGAFTIDVDEDSGSIEYWLRDKKLIKKKS
ncbi:MAG: hypothetical protein GY810_26730 [Aureispira sp.]|nr:hypothetical protein [Aureispira sp.]